MFTNMSENFITDCMLINAALNSVTLQGLVGLHMLYNIWRRFYEFYCCKALFLHKSFNKITVDHLYLCMGFISKSNYLMKFNYILLWLKAHAEAGWKKVLDLIAGTLVPNATCLWFSKRNCFNWNLWQFAR